MRSENLESVLQRFALPVIQATTREPITPIIRQRVSELREGGSSLPSAIGRIITIEATKAWEPLLMRRLQLPQTDNPLLSLSTLYCLAPNAVGLAEDYIKGEEVVEEGVEATDSFWQRYGQPLDTTARTTASAHGHLELNKLADLLKKDPSGFSVIDRVVRGPFLPNSPITIVLEHSRALPRVIRLGGQRYKNIYREIEGTPK
jgi:hypothetical protein